MVVNAMESQGIWEKPIVPVKLLTGNLHLSNLVPRSHTEANMPCWAEGTGTHPQIARPNSLHLPGLHSPPTWLKAGISC
jgi:hypothetical protein